ncbi:acyl-CoA dehydrogenase/oxidase C-terminal [Umbelopsis sp. PMI_123]|nr:acyl-CoA dehydrogenase/oxidase C-terminal [Umbelopsis sp. PMI_123]
MSQVDPDLHRFGKVVVEECAPLASKCEEPGNHPRLRQYDPWCQRVDDIILPNEWKQLHDIAAREGLVAIGYERPHGEYSRLYQFAKQYLYMPFCANVSCPLSMTDGAARIIELLGTPEMKQTYYKKLTSRNPSELWTSGQWMTERPGGSDVGRSETIAELDDEANNVWSIKGFKWFSSATTADMTMLLARTVDPKTNTVKPGSKGLSLYLAELRKSDGTLNGVRVHRLKDKYGTKALPTAELELVDMKATQIGKTGRGVPNITAILNITRIYSVAGTLAGVSASLGIAKDFARKREAFGKTISMQPLHIETMVQLELVFRVLAQMCFYECLLLGRIECGDENSEEIKSNIKTLRFITPICKSFGCKIGLQAITECMEALGGQGYMEDVGIARAVRDAQVNCIWEGTTNVLGLDVLRVLSETKGEALFHFQSVMVDKISGDKESPVLENAAEAISVALDKVIAFVGSVKNRLEMEASARDITFALGKILAGALLYEQAAWAVQNKSSSAEQDLIAVSRWCDPADLHKDIPQRDDKKVLEDAKLVFGLAAKL